MQLGSTRGALRSRPDVILHTGRAHYRAEPVVRLFKYSLISPVIYCQHRNFLTDRFPCQAAGSPGQAWALLYRRAKAFQRLRCSAKRGRKSPRKDEGKELPDEDLEDEDNLDVDDDPDIPELADDDFDPDALEPLEADPDDLEEVDAEGLEVDVEEEGFGDEGEGVDDFEDDPPEDPDDPGFDDDVDFPGDYDEAGQRKGLRSGRPTSVDDDDDEDEEPDFPKESIDMAMGLRERTKSPARLLDEIIDMPDDVVGDEDPMERELREPDGDGGAAEPPGRIDYPPLPDRTIKLVDLLEMAGYNIDRPGLGNIDILDLHNRPDLVTPGSLYFCTVQPDFDGHDYIEEAIDRGAVAVVSQGVLADYEGPVPVLVMEDAAEAEMNISNAFYDTPSLRMTTVGVMGSCGKTTTSWLVRGIFEEMQRLTGMVGSLENSIYADKMAIDGQIWQPEEEDTTLSRDSSAPFKLAPYEGKYPMPDASPDTLHMQKLLAGMADRGASAAVVELDALSLVTYAAKSVDYDVLVMTGIETEKANQSGSLEDYIQVHEDMLASLHDFSRQRAVINIDDPHAERMLMAVGQRVPVVTYSMSNKAANVFVKKLRLSLWETEVLVQTPVGILQIITPLIGRFNVNNIIAAVAVGLCAALGGDHIPLKTIVQGIEATEIVPGRCEVIDESQPFGVVVDAARTPAELSRLLDSLRELKPRRILLVTGCQGGLQRDLRPLMGQVAHYKADIVILTNDNPRHERPNDIIADIVSGYPDKILERNAQMSFQPGFLQDPGRVDYNALDFLWQYQFEYQRYVMEDRWMAIRYAIGTAQPEDVVVIAGKGAEDYQEIYEPETGQLERGWFDDRVEARNALAKVPLLWEVRSLERSELPWLEPGEREPRLYAAIDQSQI